MHARRLFAVGNAQGLVRASAEVADGTSEIDRQGGA